MFCLMENMICLVRFANGHKSTRTCPSVFYVVEVTAATLSSLPTSEAAMSHVSKTRILTFNSDKKSGFPTDLNSFKKCKNARPLFLTLFCFQPKKFHSGFNASNFAWKVRKFTRVCSYNANTLHLPKHRIFVHNAFRQWSWQCKTIISTFWMILQRIQCVLIARKLAFPICSRSSHPILPLSLKQTRIWRQTKSGLVIGRRILTSL